MCVNCDFMTYVESALNDGAAGNLNAMPPQLRATPKHINEFLHTSGMCVLEKQLLACRHLQRLEPKDMFLPVVVSGWVGVATYYNARWKVEMHLFLARAACVAGAALCELKFPLAEAERILGVEAPAVDSAVLLQANTDVREASQMAMVLAISMNRQMEALLAETARANAPRIDR